MSFIITEATREQLKLRLALTGTAGSGKTYTAMLLAQRIAEREGSNYCVIDTEHGRAKLYGQQFAANGKRPGHIDFGAPFSPERYVEAIHAVEKAGNFGTIVIDSLSHEWIGDGGALSLVDELGTGRGGKFVSGWGAVTPMHNRLLEAILQSPLHIIATLRAKTGYAMDQQSKVVTKLGMEVVQRDGVDFEFDLVFDMETPNAKATLSKSRCHALSAGKVIVKPGPDIADTLLAWLDEGAEPAPRQQAPAPETERRPEPQQQRPATNGANGAGRMTQSAAIPRKERTPAEQAVITFWMSVKALGEQDRETGFVTDEGRIAKAVVHKALGLPVDDGTLAEWAAIEGNSYDKALAALKLGIPIVVAEPAAQGELIGAGQGAYPDGR